MKDIGQARHILGMEIIRDRQHNLIKLSQRSYLEKVLKRFAMNNAKPVNLPLGSQFKFSAAMSKI